MEAAGGETAGIDITPPPPADAGDPKFPGAGDPEAIRASSAFRASALNIVVSADRKSRSTGGLRPFLANIDAPSTVVRRSTI